ncbi:MAG: family 43 glycosylhydrolase [Spirochaetales bacterium]|nr:family 43 glycosylhydrolase [Spirochaetales bacterium]
MKRQAFNPFLPATEYIPDGEPYIFNDRVYVYGSHDRFNGFIFCLNDYVCWSASIDNLSDWRFEGVIYKKNQDPKNRLGIRLLFAPDVVKGQDGRFYLYYAFDFMGIMGVAVCDEPSGHYEFLGHIRHADGTLWGRKRGDSLPFDPAVLNDNGKIYLYSGFTLSIPRLFTGMKKLKTDGGRILELEDDMLTIKTPEKLIFPKEGNASFKGHEFFEASSIRKINDKYYFVYSSKHNHELCYAVSHKPDDGFLYGGVLVSNADIFEHDKTRSRAVNYYGNNHGGLLKFKDEYFIFYHRQTNRNSYSRQACAEKVTMLSSGAFEQAELTSCGLNCKPLIGRGSYEARIACNLFSKDGAGRYDVRNSKKVFKEHPYFTQSRKDGMSSSIGYIANMRDGATAVFKYFKFVSCSQLSVKVQGRADGTLTVCADEHKKKAVAIIPIILKKKGIKEFSGLINIPDGIYPLYFEFTGIGSIDFYSFVLK